MRYMIDTYGNVDLGTLDWNISGSNFYAYYISNNIKKPEDDNTTANIYCNLYRAVPLNASFVEGDMALSTNGYLYIRDTRYTTTAEFKEAMRGQILRYKLETPANGGYLPMYKGRYKVSDYCQFIKPNLFYNPTAAGLTITSNGNTFTVNGTSTKKSSIGAEIKNWTPVIGHKILVSGCPEGGGANTFRLGAFNQRDAFDSGNGAIGSVITTGNWFGIVFESGVTFNNLIFKPQLFDLTEMFGAGNEPTTVAEFREKFPNELYPYSPYCWAKIKQLRYLTTTKNLFNQIGAALILNNTSASAAPVNWYSWKGSKIYINRGSSDYGITFPPITLSAGTYTISAMASMNDINGSGRVVSIGYLDISKNWHNQFVTISSDNQKISYTFTLTEEAVIRTHLQGRGTASNYSNLDTSFWNIQLELGNTATPYVPYEYLPLK